MAFLYANLASLHSKAGKYKDAIVFYEQALKIEEKELINPTVVQGDKDKDDDKDKKKNSKMELRLLRDNGCLMEMYTKEDARVVLEELTRKMMRDVRRERRSRRLRYVLATACTGRRPNLRLRQRLLLRRRPAGAASKRWA